MTKHIFVTGGVVSSLGKGLTSASVGLLLESMGFKIAMQKFDPYINVDPGTMNPYQHGEVYVTEDGSETDLDLGHYERFTNARISRHSNYTTGQIYNAVISKERKGEYLGQTVQVVPHITNAIMEAVRRLNDPEVDIAITEIGGTVGDIESLPFLEAIRQFGLEEGRQNVFYIHLTLLPYLRASSEVKTKPTQQSVGKLREIGIIPDVLICRSEIPMDEGIRSKISLFCNVSKDSVLEEKDVDYSIYEIPVVLQRQGLCELVTSKLGLPFREADLTAWTRMLETVRTSADKAVIAVVGKYIELQDAYKSIFESLAHGGIANRCKVEVRRINAEDVERKGVEYFMEGVDGILVPGGFGMRGIEGKISAVRHARTKNIPYFGICLGMQCAMIEFARNVCGLHGANSREFDDKTPHPVIDLMESQKSVSNKGGTMRLGAYPCRLARESNAGRAYKAESIRERHRHRFEFNNKYREMFREKGVEFSGIWPDGDLVEIAEVKNHPWFVAVQFHPEFQSKPVKAHPLFNAFVRAAIDRRAGRAG